MIRLDPRLIYRPKETPEQVRSYREAAREYTPCIAEVAFGRATWDAGEWEGGRPLGALIKMRARLYRMGNEMRARIARRRRG